MLEFPSLSVVKCAQNRGLRDPAGNSDMFDLLHSRLSKGLEKM